MSILRGYCFGERNQYYNRLSDKEKPHQAPIEHIPMGSTAKYVRAAKLLIKCQLRVQKDRRQIYSLWAQECVEKERAWVHHKSYL